MYICLDCISSRGPTLTSRALSEVLGAPLTLLPSSAATAPEPFSAHRSENGTAAHSLPLRMSRRMEATTASKGWSPSRPHGQGQRQVHWVKTPWDG